MTDAEGRTPSPEKRPSQSSLSATIEVRWEVWTQQGSGRWTPDWNQDYDDEIQARQAFLRWPDHRARRVIRVERTIIEESSP